MPLIALFLIGLSYESSKVPTFPFLSEIRDFEELAFKVAKYAREDSVFDSSTTPDLLLGSMLLTRAKMEACHRLDTSRVSYAVLPIAKRRHGSSSEVLFLKGWWLTTVGATETMREDEPE